MRGFSEVVARNKVGVPGPTSSNRFTIGRAAFPWHLENPKPAGPVQTCETLRFNMAFGIVTINEAREAQCLPPVPWGDKPWLYPELDLVRPRKTGLTSFHQPPAITRKFRAPIVLLRE